MIVLSLCAIITVVMLSESSLIVFSIAFSVIESRLLVASSIISISGFLSSALAIASLCFCPPERFAPFSSSIVSYLRGIFSINSFALLSLQASMISSRVASSFPSIRFSLIVPLNRNIS